MLNENLRKQNEVNTQLQVEISNKDVEIEKLKTQIHLPTCQLETMNIEMGQLNKPDPIEWFDHFFLCPERNRNHLLKVN